VLKSSVPLPLFLLSLAACFALAWPHVYRASLAPGAPMAFPAGHPGTWFAPTDATGPPNPTGLYLLGVNPAGDTLIEHGISLTFFDLTSMGPSITYAAGEGWTVQAWACPAGSGYGANTLGCIDLGTYDARGTTTQTSGSVWLARGRILVAQGHVIYAQQTRYGAVSTSAIFAQAN
jgi:hypothetical protein